MANWSFPGAPTPPDRTIDWAYLLAHFAWLAPLSACPQDPIHHGEGDVLTHTQMVCAALVADPDWQRLPTSERSLLFAAALLHDVAKAQTTRVEQGRIRSPGHAQISAQWVTRLLYAHWPVHFQPVPLAQRQQIAALVRFHGLPLWFWEQASPQRSVILASQEVRTDLLAILAKADVFGRICADQGQLLERIALFADFCAEQQCWGEPYPFANPLSRFLYFQNPARDPAYTAFDETRGEVILLSGLPGAGKDSWIATHHPALPVLSLDALRAELEISPTEPQAPIIVQAKEQARHSLRQGQPFIWNATNLTRLLRTPLIRLFTDYKMRVRIVYLESPWQTLLSRNRTRTKPVPEAVLVKLAEKLEVPRIGEAHVVELGDAS